MLTTNLNVKPALVQRLLQLVDSVPSWQWSIHCSLDALGTRGEAIRDGLRVDQWLHNFELLLANPRVTLEILPSVSVLSLPDMPELIRWIIGIMRRHDLLHSYDARWRFGINMIHSPEALHPGNLTADYCVSIDQCISELQHLGQPAQHSGFMKHLENLRSIIGTRRSPRDQATMRSWFDQQGQIKQRDYWALFPMLDELCGPANSS